MATVGLGGRARPRRLTRFLATADVVRLVASGARRLVRREPPHSSRSARPRRRPTARHHRRRARCCRPAAGESIEPASVDARGSTPYFGVGRRRRQAVREGVGPGRAQRRSAVPHLPMAATARPRRRAAVLVVAACRRARGVRRPGRSRPRHPHAARSARSPRPSRTRSSSPTTRSTAGRSTAWTPDADHRRRAARRSGAAREHYERTASPTATSGWPTSSSATTARCGSSTSASARWPRPICSWPTTSPSSSPRRASSWVPSGRRRPRLRPVDRATLARAADRLRPWALSGATRTASQGTPGSARRPAVDSTSRSAMNLGVAGTRRGVGARHRSRLGRRGRAKPAIPPCGVARLPRRSTVCPAGCTGRSGCRCSSATSSSARLVGLLVASSSVTSPSRSVWSLAMVLKLVIERVVRRKMADYLQIRQRPGTSEVGAVLRGGDVPVVGAELPVGPRHPRRRASRAS